MSIKLVYAASTPSKQYYGVRVKTDWLRMRIMCPREVTCLLIDYCFSELTL